MLIPDQLRGSLLDFKENISLQDILGIIIGTFILAFGVQSVLVPVKLLHGGITGIAIVLNFLSKIDVWLWYVVLNIPIFLAGFKLVSRRFFLYSLIGTAGLSFFLALLKPVKFGVEDLFLNALLGGLIAGLGSGIVFRSKGSSGGLDIIAIIFRKYRGYSIGQTFFLINLFILAASILVTNLQLALYSAISIYVSARVVDMVQSGLQVKRTAMIISEKADDIAAAIMHNLHRGCTFLDGHGAYSGKEKKLVMTIVGKSELPRLKEIVFSIDPSGFMTVNEAIEVYGKGFRAEIHDF